MLWGLTARTTATLILCVATLEALGSPAIAAPDAYSTEIGTGCQLLRIDATNGAVAESGNPSPVRALRHRWARARGHRAHRHTRRA